MLWDLTKKLFTQTLKRYQIMRTKNQRLIAYVIYCISVFFILEVFIGLFSKMLGISWVLGEYVQQLTLDQVLIQFISCFFLTVVTTSLYILWVDKLIAMVMSIVSVMSVYLVYVLMLAPFASTTQKSLQSYDFVQFLVSLFAYFTPVFLWEFTYRWKKRRLDLKGQD